MSRLGAGHLAVDGVIVGQDRVRRDQRVERLTQSPARERDRPRDVLAADEDDVDIAIELQMLEPVVEHVDRGAEMVLGEAPGQIPIARREHGRPGQLTREHQRLVARAIEIAADAVRIADDDDAVLRPRARA